MRYLKILLVSVTLLFFVNITHAVESGDSFFKLEETLISSEEILLKLSLVSEEEINAFKVVLYYNAEELKSLILDDSGSDVDVWVRRDSDSEKITLEGGFLRSLHENIKIISFRLKPSALKKPSFSLEGNVYLGDGKGTEKNISKLIYSSESGSSYSEDNFKSDLLGPSITEVSISKNPFEDNSLLVFKVTDEGSGVAKTEVRFRRGLTWDDWINAYSPVPVPHGAWAFQIASRDNVGKESRYSGSIFPILIRNIAFIVFFIGLITTLGFILFKILVKR